MDLVDIYTLIDEDLKHVQQNIQNTLKTQLTSENSAILTHILATQGKMIRPILIFLCGYAIEHPLSPEKHTKLIQAATAIELIHIASLVHDDVIDDADTRRNTSSIKGKFGNSSAVTTGTLLYSIALQQIAETGSLNLLKEISKTVQTMCEGELLQEAIKQSKNYSVNDYYKVIESKTAVLFKTASLTSSILFSFPKPIETAFTTYATQLGYAFQLSDDYLDIFGTKKALNKKIGQDLSQGCLTLPIIETLNTLKEEHKTSILNAMNTQDTKTITDFIKTVKTPSINKKTNTIITSHIQKAKQALENINNNTFKQSLNVLADCIHERINNIN